MSTIREAAVAGTFYPGQTRQLADAVNKLLSAAAESRSAARAKAIIVPHAGYIYSGPTAAIAYALIKKNASEIRRVALLGPVHRVPVRGLALPDVDFFSTPLGEIALDREAIASINALPQITTSAVAHQFEHSLEVQLPFLQSVLNSFTLIPLAVGNASAPEVMEVLDRLWGGAETLFVISSDLSHYLPYSAAQVADRDTVDAILALRSLTTHEQACGATPINGLLLAARQRGLQPQLLDLCNSGDTAGDKNRVVGYAAFSFSES